MTALAIERAFLRVAAGYVHYRTCGDREENLPLYMAHAGPGSSQRLEGLILVLGAERRVIAPDMLGNGDSGPPPGPTTDMGFYADSVIQVMDKLGLSQFDFYGDHTGAQIGVEVAIRYPDRVRRLILHGAPLFPDDVKTEFLARYAPEVKLEEYGGHLAWVWGFVRDLTVHFPYYRTDPAHRLMSAPVLPMETRHALVVDILKSLPTFHLAYRAAFSHDMAARLPAITQPTLFLAADSDPLGVYLEAAAALTPGSVARRVATSDKAEAIRDFLGS